MPLSYVLNVPEKLVVSTASGVLTDEDVVSYYGALTAEGGIDHDFGQVIDLSGVTAVNLSLHVMNTLARAAVIRRGQRRAVIATTAETDGFARTYAAFARLHGHTMRVFPDEAAALRWVAEEGEEEAVSV